MGSNPGRDILMVCPVDGERAVATGRYVTSTRGAHSREFHVGVLFQDASLAR